MTQSRHTLVSSICFAITVVFASVAQSQDLASHQTRTSPPWVTRGVIYQIQARAFTPEGTLKAATARLPKVADLGVDILYLWPVFVSDDDPDPAGWSPRQRKSGFNNPRNPYRMKDYYHVDPEYGTDADLKAFIAEAHRLGMRVLLDMVYLHCGPNAVFLQDHPNFVKRDAGGKIVTAAWGFPGIDFSNPALREYLWKNMEYWVREFGADGYRCDVSDQIPLDFWTTARERLEKLRPDICMLAEGIRPEDQLAAFDLNYSFPWFDTVQRVFEEDSPASSIREMWQTMVSERPCGTRFVRYIDNHDIAQNCGAKRLDERWTHCGVDVGLVLIFTLDGVPFLYNGQEVADPARHSIYARLPIDWTNGKTPAGKARLEFCKKLCAMRRAERTLTEGVVVWLKNNRPDSVLSFLRRTDREEILSVLNVSNRPLDVEVDLPKDAAYRPLLVNGSSAPLAAGRTVKLDGFGFFVGKRPSKDASLGASRSESVDYRHQPPAP